MRIQLSPTKQREFMESILSKLSTQEAAKLCGLSDRTIRDWRRGKFTMQLDLVKKLCRVTKVVFPKDIELKDDYWYVAHGASAGGLAVLKKYGRIGGDPEYRRKKWYEWYEKERIKNPNGLFMTRFINKPDFSEELAEFVGILLGDGGITKRQVSFTFHSEDDQEYADYVVNLIKKLFGVYVGIHNVKDCKAVRYSISRTELVCFCINSLDLKQGSKVRQQVDIPDWIKNNVEYSVACVRGLVDTDGCVFTHRYQVNGKFYSYKKLSFTSYSVPLIKSVFNIMQNNGLKIRLAKKVRGSEVDIRIDSINDMRKYFEIFGFHNPKHLLRYGK